MSGTRQSEEERERENCEVIKGKIAITSFCNSSVIMAPT